MTQIELLSTNHSWLKAGDIGEVVEFYEDGFAVKFSNLTHPVTRQPTDVTIFCKHNEVKPHHEQSKITMAGNDAPVVEPPGTISPANAGG